MLYLNEIFFSIFYSYIPNTVGTIFDYFSCEESGHNPETPCDRSGFEHRSVYVLSILSQVSISLFPTYILLFMWNVHAQTHESKKTGCFRDLASIIITTLFQSKLSNRHMNIS